MAYWSVAQTESQREATAAEWLRRDGFEIYLPKIKITRRVVDRQERARIIARVVPLFPSYLFVRIVNRWWSIGNTIGVTQLLLAGDHPASVSDKEISKIMAQERGGLIRLPQPPGLKRGDQVRVLRGSFQDHIGVYEGMSGKQRERVLLDLLGRQVVVDLPSNDLQPLDSVHRPL
jgi:transcription antitermination factor NusG